MVRVGVRVTLYLIYMVLLTMDTLRLDIAILLNTLCMPSGMLKTLKENSQVAH